MSHQEHLFANLEKKLVRKKLNSLGEEKTIWLVAQPKPTRKPNIKICGELHFPVSPEGSGKAEGRRRKGQEQPVSRRLRPQAF